MRSTNDKDDVKGFVADKKKDTKEIQLRENTEEAFRDLVKVIGGETIKAETGSRINPLEITKKGKKLNHYEIKKMIMEVVNMGFNVVIVDPEDEYKQLGESLGIERVSSEEEVEKEEVLIFKD